MFDLEEAVAGWRVQMQAAGIMSPALLDELESHLRDEIQRLIGSRVTQDEAFQRAARELGNGAELTQEFSKVGQAAAISRGLALTINVLGVWFALIGLDSLVNAVFLLMDSSRYGLGFSLKSILYALLRIGMGIGLLRRRNSWRIFALIWCAWVCFGEFTALVMFRSDYLSLGIPLSAFRNAHLTLSHLTLFFALRFTGLFMCILGLSELGRTDVRNYFLGIGGTSAPTGGNRAEPLTAAAIWGWRARRSLLWLIWFGLASAALIPAWLIWCEEMSISERIVRIGAIGLVVLSVFEGRGRFGERLFPMLRLGTVPLGAKLGAAVVILGWATTFTNYIGMHPDMDLHDTQIAVLWALAPAGVVAGFWLGRGVRRLESVLMKWPATDSVAKADSRQVAC
jgi:hypothetical protein